VLGEVYAEGLRAAGYRVRTRLGLGDQDAALAAVTRRRVDGYPEYTGTALVAFFGVRPSRLPSDPQPARRGFASSGLVVLPAIVVQARTLPVDARTVEALARLALAARRRGRRLEVKGAGRELRALLAFVGLEAALGLEPGREAEQLEQRRGLQEEGELADPAA
jgi:osmoprotectant transport system substrate-binding protein